MKTTENKEAAPVVDLSKLTPEEMDKLRQHFATEEKEKEARQRQERATYKKLVSDEVTNLFPELEKISVLLAESKKKVFDTLNSFIALKAELYGREEDQNRHSFSNTDASITIEIGFNESDSWDDTVNTGIAKVNDYMQSLGKDKKSKDLVNMVMKLLSKDGKGNLKASRVLQLAKLAEGSGDPEFIDSIKIIQDAHRPVRSKEFVRCMFKKGDGEKTILPLSITDASLPSNETDAEHSN